MKTYKGDGMQHGTDSNKYIFVPSGNTQLVSDKTFNGNIYAFGDHVNEIKDNLKFAQEKNIYSKVFKFTYDIRSKSAIVQNLMMQRSGRYVNIEYKYNDIKETSPDRAHITTILLHGPTLNTYPQSGGNESISFNDSDFNIYENGTKVSKEFDQIKIGYYDGGKDYITNYSYDKNKIKLTIPPNPNNTQRSFHIDLQYTVNWNYSTDNTYIFRFDYYQQGIETT